MGVICTCYSEKDTCEKYRKDNNACYDCWYHDRKTQYELLQDIKDKANINIVTCGNCGDVLLHERDDVLIKCEYCWFESEPSDFPDLILEEEDED